MCIWNIEEIFKLSKKKMNRTYILSETQAHGLHARCLGWPPMHMQSSKVWHHMCLVGPAYDMRYDINGDTESIWYLAMTIIDNDVRALAVNCLVIGWYYTHQHSWGKTHTCCTWSNPRGGSCLWYEQTLHWMACGTRNTREELHVTHVVKRVHT